MKTTLDWLGCATFRLKIDDLTIFLDTYMDRVPSAPKVGLSAGDVSEADYILIGHSHFDHIGGADIISSNTGATVIGSTETYKVLTNAGINKSALRIAQGGETYRLNDHVSVKVFPSLHSCIWIPNTFDTRTDEPVTGHLNISEDDRWCCMTPMNLENADPEMVFDMKQHRQNCLGSNRIGGALCYLFETPNGSIFFQDTSGCWTGIVSDIRADIAILAMAGRPNIDGEPIQGSLADYIGMMTSMLKPSSVILGHHDDWMPPQTKDNTKHASISPIRNRINSVRPGTELLDLKYLDGTELFI